METMIYNTAQYISSIFLKSEKFDALKLLGIILSFFVSATSVHNHISISYFTTE